MKVTTLMMYHLETQKNSKSETTMADDEVHSATHITDLCENCLLTVFQNLSVTDLVNLSEANITGKFRKRTYKIDQYKQTIVKAFKLNKGVNAFKTSVHTDAPFAPNEIKMLKCFGSAIESLTINYCNNNRRYESALDEAVSNNCWKTLSSVDFRYFTNDSMNELARPFINVEVVEFGDGHLGRHLGQLNKWFPKVVELEFVDTHVFDTLCIHEHFPQLTSLLVWNGRWQESKEEKRIFTNSDLKVFLQLNPQLEALNIRHDDVDETESGSNAIIVDAELLTFIDENMMELDTLKLNLENYHFDRKWQSTVYFDNLTTLDIECGNCDCLDKIKITMTSEWNILNLNVTNQSDQHQSNQHQSDQHQSDQLQLLRL